MSIWFRIPIPNIQKLVSMFNMNTHKEKNEVFRQALLLGMSPYFMGAISMDDYVPWTL